MAVQYVDLDDKCILDGNNKDVIINVQVGDGQPGYSINAFVDQTLINPDPGDRHSFNLGSATGLHGKQLMVVVVVKDQLAQTNWTSFTLDKTQGNGPKKTYGPYRKEAEKHLDTVIYTLKIKMQ